MNADIREELNRLDERINTQRGALQQEFKRLDERINIQRQTSQQMWQKLKPSVDLAEWIQKTYPELMEQFAAIKDLERLSGDRVGVGGFARPEVKAEGAEVRYGNI